MSKTSPSVFILLILGEVKANVEGGGINISDMALTAVVSVLLNSKKTGIFSYEDSWHIPLFSSSWHEERAEL